MKKKRSWKKPEEKIRDLEKNKHESVGRFPVSNNTTQGIVGQCL